MSEPLKVFITYSHRDKAAKNTLIDRLAVMRQQGLITIWHDNEILPGDRWYEDIAENLVGSDILLYLVSASSLASENCNKELGEALDIKIRVSPIILEDCDWKNHQLGDIEALPDKGKPINEWQPESSGWQNVVEGIRKVVGEMQALTSENAKKEILPEWVFQQGNFLMMIRQIDKAIEAYSHVTELNPRYAEAYNNRGFAYIDKGMYDCAFGDLNKAIELNPELVEAYNNRGIAYVRKGTVDRAIEDFNKAIKLNQDFAEAYNNRGTAYVFIHAYDRAIEDFNKAIKLNSNYAKAYNNRGNAYLFIYVYDRAIEDFNKAIKLNSNYAGAYNNRGNAYSSIGAYDCAIKDFSKAIKLRDFTPTYFNRGICWLYLQNWQEAKTDLTVARSRGVDIIKAFYDDYQNVGEFERRYGVKLPEDIAAMLTQR